MRDAFGDDGSGPARLLAVAEDAFRQIGVLGDVRAERARLGVRRTVARWKASFCIGVAMLVLVAAGSALVVIGTVEFFRALLAETPGLGELSAGAVLLAGALAWGAVRRLRLERAEMKRLEAKFGGPGGGDGRSRGSGPTSDA